LSAAVIVPEIGHLAVPISTLSPYPNNPRRGNVDAIAASLTAHGQYRPILARSTGVVLAGNHTLAAAQQLGWQEIAAVQIDVDDETATRIVLADNRTADLGTIDDADLLTLLSELADTDAALVGTGYTLDDLGALLPDFTPAEDDLANRLDVGAEKLCPYCGAHWRDSANGPERLT
jgi:ParB-like chromosome segregation protein Spo0J